MHKRSRCVLKIGGHQINSVESERPNDYNKHRGELNGASVMAKLKSIVFIAGVMLLILAAAMGYLSIKYLSAILPADSYEDKGVYILCL